MIIRQEKSYLFFILSNTSITEKINCYFAIGVKKCKENLNLKINNGLIYSGFDKINVLAKCQTIRVRRFYSVNN